MQGTNSGTAQMKTLQLAAIKLLHFPLPASRVYSPEMCLSRCLPFPTSLSPLLQNVKQLGAMNSKHSLWPVLGLSLARGRERHHKPLTSRWRSLLT